VRVGRPGARPGRARRPRLRRQAPRRAGAARHAIADARDAQERIDQAERDIAAAQARQAAAASAAAAASREIALSTAAGVPALAAEASRSQAWSDGAAAADDEARARRELARARDDLERAKRRGHEAMDDARDAGRAAAAAFASAAGISPAYAALGGPAAGAMGGGGAPGFWDTTNEGAQWWDEDQFLAQLLFFHPRNDEVGHYKWWGDQALGIGADWASGALVARGMGLRQAAIQDVTEYTLRYGRTFVAGRGGSVLVESASLTSRTTTVIDADLLAQAGRFGTAGKALPIIGGALAMGSAGWDQWREDASNPNLTTTDRVGRAAGVGVYVGGASVAGAAIGTAIFPGVGTVAGLAIGAGAGLVAGAVASSITPVKEAMADAGQWAANAAVDTYNWGADRVSDIGDGLSQGADWVRDKLPDIDIDMPDLNPF
jgi:hypothetical protein